jgi:hypothetical protein
VLLRVGSWEDPVVDRVGVDPRGTYAELFWLPVVGPSALWLVRRLVERLDGEPDGYLLDPIETAQALGIGGPDTRHAPLTRTLRRCERFGLVRLGPGQRSMEVRRRIGPVPRHRLHRLPQSLQAAHAAWELPDPAAEALRRARAAATDLAVLGEGRAAVERRLLRLGVHPAVAFAAAQWADERWADGPCANLGAPSSVPGRRLDGQVAGAESGDG